jgi:hypothetical protein
MWKLVFCSVQGTSHERAGQPCQDYCAGQIIASACGDVLIAACADGAGSAELSDVGAKLAVEAFLKNATGELSKGDAGASAPDRSVILGWMADIRRQIEAEATARQATPRQMACTLLAAMVGPTWSVFTQIGDGVIVFDAPEGFQFAFWPESGEYINTTRFLTDADYEAHVGIDHLERCVCDVAMLTDGLQMLALSYAEGRVHNKFFGPMLDALRNAPADQSVQSGLVAFLGSKRVNERTDDDKSLVLATRRLPDNHESAGITEAD